VNGSAYLVSCAVFEAEPEELVRRCSWSFTLVHGLLEAGPTLHDCALVQLEGLADGVPVNLLGGLVLATSVARVRARDIHLGFRHG
jgi:hypothetical protein